MSANIGKQLSQDIKQYQRRQHLVDVTEIFNQLGREKKRRLFKIVSLIVLLFLSLFWMIWSVLSEEDE